MDENALDHLNDPSGCAGKQHDCFDLRQSWKYLDALHQRVPVFHLWDYPNVDDLKLVGPNVDDLMNDLLTVRLIIDFVESKLRASSTVQHN